MPSPCFLVAVAPSEAPFVALTFALANKMNATASRLNFVGLVGILPAFYRACVRVHDPYVHAIFQIDVAWQRNHFALLQSARDFIVRRIGNSHMDLALLQLGLREVALL